MDYAYKPTTHGRAVMAACMALEKPFHITRVAFGSGKVDEETNLADVHALLEYVSDGAVAERRHEDDRFYLTIQFANSEHREIKTFLLSEFIVYVEDPETGEETDLLYGTLGDYRQPVPAYNPAFPPSVFNFPLTLILSDEINVSVSAPAGLPTYDDILRLQKQMDELAGRATLHIGGQEPEGPGLWFDTSVPLTPNTAFVLKLGGDDDAADLLVNLDGKDRPVMNAAVSGGEGGQVSIEITK